MNPFYSEPAFNSLGASWVDQGLGGYLKAAGYDASVYEPALGMFKVPTLRNVGKQSGVNFPKAYGYNGYFKSLEEVVHFYNTRDTMPWPAPEYAATVNQTQVGDLGLTPAEEKSIVAFLKTLSDEISTKLTMNVNPTTLKLGRSAHFFGVITPNMVDRTPIRLMVRKAGQTKWTNVAPYVRTYSAQYWSFYYHPNTRGTYYFKVQYSATAMYLGSTSRTVTVVWK